MAGQEGTAGLTPAVFDRQVPGSASIAPMAVVFTEPGRPMASARALVAVNLEFAVPDAIRALGAVPGPARERLAGECAALLEAHGDAAWLAVRAHEDDAGLTRLARGLAALACRPGGVSFLGTRWVAVAVRDAGQAAA